MTFPEGVIVAADYCIQIQHIIYFNIPCRCKNEGLGNPKLKVALTYEPQTTDLLQSTVATTTDDNDNTLATVKAELYTITDLLI